MDISIIIPVANDLRLRDCLQSIDEDVEVIVSMNGPTPDIKRIVKESGRDSCELAERNLGAALDEGIHAASNERVLLIDSDCTFNPGTIRMLYEGLEGYKLAKGRVLFQTKGYPSHVIARAREYTTSDRITAYKPPLAMRRSIKSDIGGYLYDRDIHWVEDAEFDRRVQINDIPINYIVEATINHPPLTPCTDLRSAWRYGVGKRIGVEKNLMKGLGAFYDKEIDIASKKGLDVAAYMLAWNSAYTLGWVSQALFDVYSVRKKFRN
ncbi:MAG: glycosyltransferase family 2 protein [Candidatus Aenigmarchaeota archaeon]|nr:glycosyltransferase family 2 protein [Candidatus Aenigmarchaeota archaeon]